MGECKNLKKAEKAEQAARDLAQQQEATQNNMAEQSSLTHGYGHQQHVRDPTAWAGDAHHGNQSLSGDLFQAHPSGAMYASLGPDPNMFSAPTNGNGHPFAPSGGLTSSGFHSHYSQRPLTQPVAQSQQQLRTAYQNGIPDYAQPLPQQHVPTMSAPSLPVLSSLPTTVAIVPPSTPTPAPPDMSSLLRKRTVEDPEVEDTETGANVKAKRARNTTSSRAPPSAPG